MRRVLVSFAAVGLLLAAHDRSRADDKAKPDTAVGTMKQLEPLVGSFDCKSTSYGADGKTTTTDAGTVMGEFHSAGHVLTIVKSVKRSNGETYDDSMVFFFNPDDSKIHALLFSLWDNPRQIDVSTDGGKITLNYAPVKGDSGPVQTRETITPNADGSLHFTIEHQTADGSFSKHREIDAMKK